MPPSQELILYHGTSRDNADLIQSHGFKASSSGCLGAGVYVAHHDKAFRFAADCPRHGGDAGVLVKVRITFKNAKYVCGDDDTWQGRGHDACRAEYTSRSARMEWCLKSTRQVEILGIQPIECGAALPKFELPGFEEALSLDSVRRLAAAEGMKEVAFDESAKVVSLCAGSGHQDERRFNVYYVSGTVGTSYEHPRRGRAQCFRRNADMQTLGELFRLSRQIHSACTCHQRQPHQAFAAPPPRGQQVAVGAEEEEVHATLEQLRKEAKDAEEILADHQMRRDEAARRDAEQRRREEDRKRREAEEREREEQRQQKEAARQERLRQQRLRGTECTYNLPPAWHENTEDSFGAGTLSVALGDGCIFMLHEGDYSHNGNVPKGLENKLKGRQSHLPSPKYVSIGSSDRYYIQFANGAAQWNGPDDLTEELQGTTRSVRSVAFGEDYDTWFVVYSDGYWKWNGEIPSGLCKVLTDRDKKSDLKHVSLGPEGQYYISVANGRAWWGGTGDENLELIRRYKSSLTFMDFGRDDRLFIRYE